MVTPAKTFENLLVWKKAHTVVLAVYKVTESFPELELFGLTSQFRRAAVLNAANIAEQLLEVLKLLASSIKKMEEKLPGVSG